MFVADFRKGKGVVDTGRVVENLALVHLGFLELFLETSILFTEYDCDFDLIRSGRDSRMMT